MSIQEQMKKRYPATCPHCQKEIYVARSLGIIGGWSLTGIGKCCFCSKYSYIVYDTDTDTLQAVNDEFASRLNQPLPERIFRS